VGGEPKRDSLLCDQGVDFSAPVQIIDPVNKENNVSALYTRYQADLIVQAAMDAGDAIDAAEFAQTKDEKTSYWKSVFGASFTG
jgi:hypothetical protein